MLRIGNINYSLIMNQFVARRVPLLQHLSPYFEKHYCKIDRHFGDSMQRAFLMILKGYKSLGKQCLKMIENLVIDL